MDSDGGGSMLKNYPANDLSMRAWTKSYDSVVYVFEILLDSNSTLTEGLKLWTAEASFLFWGKFLLTLIFSQLEETLVKTSRHFGQFSMNWILG